MNVEDGEWVSVDHELPAPGDYQVKVDRNGDIMHMSKRFMRSGEHTRWMGGCRPFCENDVVLFWKKVIKPT